MARSFSIEDGNLQSSITGSRNRKYSDVDLTFNTNTINDVYKKLDAGAVKQSVKNILLTSYHEKPFRPYFDTNLNDILFELFDQSLMNDIDLRIKTAIQNYEPRAKIEDISVTELRDINALYITIIFSIVNTGEKVTLTTTITRLR